VKRYSNEGRGKDAHGVSNKLGRVASGN